MRWMLTLVVVGCGAAPTPRLSLPTKPHPAPARAPAPAPARAPAPAPAPAAAAAAASAPSSFLDRQPLAGCNDSDLPTLHQRIAALDPEPPAALPSPSAIERELASLWKHPCLAHVARYAPLPRVTVTGQPLGLYVRQISGALRSMAGGFYVREGQRAFIAPPSLAPTDLPKALAPWRCTTKDCGHAATYVQRAHAAYDAAHAYDAVWRAHYPDSADCRGPMSFEGPGTPFEKWLGCARESAPVTYRYPEGVHFRAPTAGWLWLRGRRGHYDFADEVRAYDLATGAAYVASSHGKLSFGAHAMVDHAATDAARQPSVVAGNVSAEAVRELAFLLLTLDAPQPVQLELERVPLPPGLTLALGQSKPATTAPRDAESGSSADTEIAYDWLDGKSRAHGRFTWPSAWRDSEDYADDVVRALEAGFEPGCPAAKLPKIPAARDEGGVSSLDADPKRRAGTMSELEQALVGLVPKCP